MHYARTCAHQAARNIPHRRAQRFHLVRQEEVALLMQRVGEAQRFAAVDMRGKDTKQKAGGKKRSRDDDEDNADPELQRMMKQGQKKFASKRK
jgi:hypothetical protein